MMKRLCVFLLILGAMASARAQQPDFGIVDAQTYRCFMEQKWDSVILAGNQALQNHVDYYYLRVRTGIAYFHKKNYLRAAEHLEKAREFNAAEAYVAAYLRDAYLEMDRREEAELLRTATPPSAPETMAKKPAFTDFVRLGAGYTFSSLKPPGKKSGLAGRDSIYGEEDLYGDSRFADFAIGLHPSSRLRIAAGYTRLYFDKTRIIEYSVPEVKMTGTTDTAGGYLFNYAFPYKVSDTVINYGVTQQEVHLSASFAPGSGFRIMPAVHLLHVAYPLTRVSYRPDTVSLPVFYSTADSMLYSAPVVIPAYTFTQSDTAFTNWVVSLLVTRNTGLFTPGISASWSNLNGRIQKQAGISVTWYPLGNLYLYGTTGLTGFFQEDVSRLLLSQTLGVKLLPRLWAEGGFHWGDFTNANILNGTVAFNNVDKINFRTGGTVTFLAGNHLTLTAVFQYMQRENYRWKYESTGTEARPLRENHRYGTATFYAGITWKF